MKLKWIINGKFMGQRLTGVQRYARELTLEFDKFCKELDVEIVLPKDAEKNCPPLQNIVKVVKGKKSSALWEQTVFARYVKKRRGVSVNLCNSAPLFARKIVCIHDMKPFAHPEFFSKKFRLWYRVLFRNIMRKADAVLTVSEFSKREIARYFPKAKPEVYVVQNAWQHFKRIVPDGEALQRYGLRRGEYYFAMSSLEPNKNLKWIANEAANTDAVFAVAGGIDRKIFSGVEETLPENVKLLGYITDEEAKALMAGCRAFLFVTFYEGFGLPPLEALSAGAPCAVVSDTEVMREVLGDSAVFLSPNRYDYDLNAVAVPQNADCLERYSWEKSALKLFEILSHRTGERSPQTGQGE